MTSASMNVSGGGFDFSVPSVGGQWSWTVVANNIQGAGQTYQFININTPYGSLYTAAIPIPGDVVAQMASSLNLVQQQLAPLMRLISPSPASLNVTITEGDPMSSAGNVVLQNVGAFGSFMSVTATPDTPWLSSSPASAGSIAMNQNSQFALTLNPGTLLASGSPYVGHVNFQDNRNPPTVISVAVSVTVLPKPVLATDPASIILTYALLTGTSNGPHSMDVTNVGLAGSSMDFSISAVLNSPWLTFDPPIGGPLASAAMATVLVSLVPAGIPLQVGVFSDILRVSSPTAMNGFVDIPVTLIVS